MWYEWHAESFLTVPRKATSNDDMLLQAGFPSPALGSPAPPSPMVDHDPFTTPSKQSRVAGNGNGAMMTPAATSSKQLASREMEFELVKIGHTSLHNPGGRSSWIGL